MIRGIYTSVAASKAHEARLNLLMNNIANAQTPGYKQNLAANTGFNEMMVSRVTGSPGDTTGTGQVGPLATAIAASEPIVDFSAGSLVQTERPLDLALRGPGFFALRTPQGVRYTRYGNLRVDDQGVLMLPDRNRVLGADGQPIRLGPGTVRIDEAGNILIDEKVAGRLHLVEIPQQALSRVDDNYYEAVNPQAVKEARSTTVSQGQLENSNVDPSRTVMDLMGMMRSYNSTLEVMRLQDDVLGRAVTEVGRLNP